jgi:hypothetical protein
MKGFRFRVSGFSPAAGRRTASLIEEEALRGRRSYSAAATFSERSLGLFRQLALLGPFRTGGFHLSPVLEHALAAFHFDIGYIPVTGFDFLRGHHLSPAASTLWTCGFNAVTFLCHATTSFAEFFLIARSVYNPSHSGFSQTLAAEAARLIK